MIYAVIIVMWGAYFIPLWLRRHEERSEARSVDRFANAMRTLARRHPDAAQAEAASAPARGHGTAAGARRAHRPRTKQALVYRRRRVLVGLIVAMLATALLTPITPVPWPVPLATLGATLGYLVHLRLQARRTRDLSRTRETVRRRTISRLSRFEAAERIFHARRTLRAERAAAEAERRGADEAAQSLARQETRAWQPTPFPLPTYVTKPVAPRPAAPMAMEQSEQAQQPFDQTVAVGTAPAAADDVDESAEFDFGDEQLDAIVARRRVVND